MGWATDGGEDIGGQMADHDAWMELQEELSGIKEDRKYRIRSLAGKYVVCAKGKSSGDMTFYQDRLISSGGYWTKYLSNALGFVDMDKAKLHAGSFKYGNPKVAIVTSEGNYQWVEY